MCFVHAMSFEMHLYFQGHLAIDLFKKRLKNGASCHVDSGIQYQ